MSRRVLSRPGGQRMVTYTTYDPQERGMPIPVEQTIPANYVTYEEPPRRMRSMIVRRPVYMPQQPPTPAPTPAPAPAPTPAPAPAPAPAPTPSGPTGYGYNGYGYNGYNGYGGGGYGGGYPNNNPANQQAPGFDYQQANQLCGYPNNPVNQQANQMCGYPNPQQQANQMCGYPNPQQQANQLCGYPNPQQQANQLCGYPNPQQQGCCPSVQPCAVNPCGQPVAQNGCCTVVPVPMPPPPPPSYFEDDTMLSTMMSLVRSNSLDKQGILSTLGSGGLTLSQMRALLQSSAHDPTVSKLCQLLIAAGVFDNPEDPSQTCPCPDQNKGQFLPCPVCVECQQQVPRLGQALCTECLRDRKQRDRCMRDFRRMLKMYRQEYKRQYKLWMMYNQSMREADEALAEDDVCDTAESDDDEE